MEEECLFCKMVSGEIPSDKIYEDDKVFAFLDIQPANAGHTLVIPKKHSKNILEIENEDLEATIQIVKMLAKKIIKAVKAQGFNIIINTEKVAGQIVFHTHFHLVPRFEDDSRELHWKGDPMDFPRHRVLKMIKEELKK